MHHKKLIWMISSLVTDANRDAIFSQVAQGQIEKDIWSLTSQSELALSTLSTILVYTSYT